MTMKSGASMQGTDRFGLSLDDLLRAASAGAVAPVRSSGPRARRRLAARQAYAPTSAIAAALLLEGCITTEASGPDMVGGATGGGNGTGGATPGAASPSAYGVVENGATAVPVTSLLATAPGADSIVSIVSAEHGTAVLQGSVVVFTAANGYSGAASITFTFRTATGELRTGTFRLAVDDDIAAAQGHTAHAGGEHGGHGTGGGAQGGHGGPTGHEEHGNDPAKAAEHDALLDLVPHATATHVAVRDGSWFDPTTWANGQVPGAGARVLIPEGVNVAYDGASPASIFTVRVDGALNFATDRDTFLEVDTFVVSSTGKLTIGTADDPVRADVEAVISIADNGPINVDWDPSLLSRGLLSLGEVQIHGAQKESFLRVAVDPMAGHTSVTLEAIPEGWRVGDKIVIAGTHLTPPSTSVEGAVRTSTSEDEERTIVAINGNTVVFDRPLVYNHEGARADLKTYVANYTRNVRIETENADSVAVHERGHVMFMHSNDVDVRYAEFFELGRTDKSTRAFDPDDLAALTSTSNLKGRYSLHVHRSGVGEPDDPVMIVGNAVWGSPGWGYVHHDSNAIFSGNAAYDVFGAAYVAELGTETGRWSNNISIKTTGVSSSNKDQEDMAAFDNGRNGAGFWFQGRMVEAVDNVVAGAAGTAYVYLHRSPIELTNVVDPRNAPFNDTLRYRDRVEIDHPHISKFEGNIAFASDTGLHIVKNSPTQGHDARSVIEDFLAWEVRSGLGVEYTAHYTFINIDLLASDTVMPLSPVRTGLTLGGETFDIVIDGARIVGFQTGVHAVKANSRNIPSSEYDYFFIDVENIGSSIPWINVSSSERMTSAQAVVGDTLSYVSALGSTFPLAPGTPGQGESLVLNGTKTDSLGVTPISNIYDPFGVGVSALRGAIEQNGWWTTTNGKKVTLFEEYVADRLTGEMIKVGIFVEIPREYDPTTTTLLRSVPDYHGVLNPADLSPVAQNDSATVASGGSIVIDVLANDFDPEGGDIDLDGLESGYGYVVDNGDGTVTYFADPGQTGPDTFYYWVADDQGNFTKAAVNVNVVDA